jgi:hypothetical protein
MLESTRQEQYSYLLRAKDYVGNRRPGRSITYSYSCLLRGEENVTQRRQSSSSDAGEHQAGA